MFLHSNARICMFFMFSSVFLVFQFNRLGSDSIFSLSFVFLAVFRCFRVEHPSSDSPLVVAFLSDRDGQWGIWVMPRTGGEPKKIVDYSKINTSPVLWGEGDRHWTFDRISWGP